MGLPYGAKRIAHAYMLQFLEERKEELKTLFGSGEEG